MKFKKPSVAATVAIFSENDFLLIERKTNPFKGKLAFPGGYLNVDKESIHQTAIRELFEETGVKILRKNLILIDVRSNPKRDPRGHVVDIGFLCIQNAKPKIKDSNETKPVWISKKEINNIDFAFDHMLFWSHIKDFLSKKSI